MQAEAPQKTAVIREKPSQWVTADATDLQHPEDSGLAQVGIFTCSSPPEVPLEESLRFYVAHANAGNRNMSESPVTSDIFRYPPESRTAAAVALAADKEDRLLHLAFDSEGFSVKYRHDVIGWEASRDRSSATLFLSSNRRLIVTSSERLCVGLC
ncbi:hypothetical protein, conserved [Eimeria necatrix]|uniref:Uncharacterized protein n=1 Tax=Eimeria necatrix TaxID=51315 RepID=U6MST6_9EIME|nr:hypothetical protein, conserved [Eimeria necatrix]CDJ67066.1 hypothetical protein, conserved [Eimeria necatrix]